MNSEPKTGAAFERVVGIMRRLRAPGGCPWDRDQTFDSIRRHTIEETYEVLEAIGNRDWPHVQEELGDLLLQVVFYATMAEEAGHFSIDAVLDGLGDKLVRRHPHVFEETGSDRLSPQEALGRWDAVKAAEKKATPSSKMDGIAKDLPALAEAGKTGQRAAAVGFDWPSVEGVWTKLAEEIGELRAEMGGDPQRQEDELGDVLFTLGNLARHLQLEPESALKRANRKFQNRFRAVEAEAARQGRALDDLNEAEWDRLWTQAKAETPAS